MGSGTKEEGFVTFCLTKILLFEFLNFFFSFWEFFLPRLNYEFLTYGMKLPKDSNPMLKETVAPTG